MGGKPRPGVTMRPTGAIPTAASLPTEPAMPPSAPDAFDRKIRELVDHAQRAVNAAIPAVELTLLERMIVEVGQLDGGMVGKDGKDGPDDWDRGWSNAVRAAQDTLRHAADAARTRMLEPRAALDSNGEERG